MKKLLISTALLCSVFTYSSDCTRELAEEKFSMMLRSGWQNYDFKKLQTSDGAIEVDSEETVSIVAFYSEVTSDDFEGITEVLGYFTYNLETCKILDIGFGESRKI